ncbi:MAG: hypothetical protein ABIH40_05870 [Candidatus Omnitrophota bacterium]
MRKIASVALLNFKQAIRDRIFLGVIFFFVFFLAFCALLGKLSPGETGKVLRNAGLAGIELSALILVVFSLTFSFYREKDSRMLEIYLSNFSRTAYISGKLGGYLLISVFYLALSAIGYILLLCFYGAFLWQPIIGLYPLFLKLSIIVGFCLVFSCLFSSPVIALLSSLSLYFASETAYPALKVIGLEAGEVKVFLFKCLYYLLPNMNKLDIKSLAIYGRLPELSFFLLISLYSFGYILFLWLIARFIFTRREY